MDEFTIDELAARTGMTVRTVRFYATEGLLPAPVRRGRIAYYGPAHRMRLELIRTLQEHGYTLAAIERVLARVPADASPAEYAVQAAVLAPWLPDQSEELDARGAGAPLRPADDRRRVRLPRRGRAWCVRSATTGTRCRPRCSGTRSSCSSCPSRVGAA